MTLNSSTRSISLLACFNKIGLNLGSRLEISLAYWAFRIHFLASSQVFFVWPTLKCLFPNVTHHFSCHTTFARKIEFSYLAYVILFLSDNICPAYLSSLVHFSARWCCNDPIGSSDTSFLASADFNRWYCTLHTVNSTTQQAWAFLSDFEGRYSEVCYQGICSSSNNSWSKCSGRWFNS